MIPTLQPAHFGRVYAAYGGMFIVLSLLWGWAVDGTRPDRFDTIEAMLCLVGMVVIMYAHEPSRILKKTASGVLASFRPSTYRAYWRQSTYPLACDRSERVKRSLVCTSSALHSLQP